MTLPLLQVARPVARVSQPGSSWAPLAKPLDIGVLYSGIAGTSQRNGSHPSYVATNAYGYWEQYPTGATYASGFWLLQAKPMYAGLGSSFLWHGRITAHSASYPYVAGKWQTPSVSGNNAGQFYLMISAAGDIGVTVHRGASGVSTLYTSIQAQLGVPITVLLNFSDLGIDVITSKGREFLSLTGIGGLGSAAAAFGVTIGAPGSGYSGHQYARTGLMVWSDKTLPDDVVKNPWQVFAPVDRKLFLPLSVGGGTTTVTSDAAASYKVQGSVQSSSVASYGIRSAIQSSAASGYNIRAAIQQDAPGSYRIRGLTQQSSTLAYGIRGLVDQAIAASYAVRGAVSSDASATYSILSATSVSASASAGYSIRGSIQQSSAASYSLRGSVTQDTSATYSIRGSINQDTAAIYALRGSVTQDTSAAYNILSASAVSSSVTAGYAIKGSVQSSIVAGYSIAQAVQAEIAASYIIRSGVVSEAQAAYVILGLVYQSIAASYVVDGGLFSGPIIPRLTRLSALTQRVDQLSIITRNVMLCSTIGAGE